MDGSPRLAKSAMILLAAALIVGPAGCRREDNSVPEVEFQDRIIATAALTEDSTKLALSWFTAPCESFDEVQVELDDKYANLLVRVRVDTNTCPAESPGEVIVDLGEPLGDREIYDRAFGDTVALE